MRASAGLVLFVSSLLGGSVGCGLNEDTVATELEKQALAKARSVHPGMLEADVVERLGPATYSLVSDNESRARATVVATGHVTTGGERSIQTRFGCGTILSVRRIGRRVLVSDLHPTVRVCVYLNEAGVVQDSEYVWH